MTAQRALAFGALNIDIVYQVPHIILPGETITSSGRETHCGGKGLNQAVALARAGIPTFMAGSIGSDGQQLVEFLVDAGVDMSNVVVSSEPSGHALIQVDPNAANCIILHPGANRAITPQAVSQTLAGFGAGDFLIVQNETNLIDRIVAEGAERGMIVAYNPSPFDADALRVDLALVDYLFVNEVEAVGLADRSTAAEALEELVARFPHTSIVMTLGSQGAVYAHGPERCRVDATRVQAVDTTAAGDTFTGFFLASVMRGSSPQRALEIARDAAGLAVSRAGAATSIPTWDEVV